MANLYNFITDNKFKTETLLSYWYAAIFRIQILLIKPKHMKKHWGEEGKESVEQEPMEIYKYAASISRIVNRICNKTSWESKCLVRALTAQKLLKRKKIHSTMYLGCKMDEGKMVAHAWLRCGAMYVTGGNGANDGYAVVDKFYM
ncbi:MAG: lasso peptide biosynthesis B2 protein [Lachnospiraceae bacterium]|nr:lasso peptide biosynthesis B2 protein [Lachnospiraceae bacterium]